MLNVSPDDRGRDVGPGGDCRDRGAMPSASLRGSRLPGWGNLEAGDVAAPAMS
jgi:hypothetical protein